MAEELSPLEKQLRGLRPRTVDDFPPTDWKDAASRRKPRGAQDPTSQQRQRGQSAPAGRKKG